MPDGRPQTGVRTPPAALRRFLAAYDPAVARLFLAARAAVLDAAPGASELVYDAYNAVATAYSFTDRLKEAFCHVAAYRRYVNLGFNQGATLPDPEGLLVGSGARIRHIRIAAVADVRRPGVRKLLRAAVRRGRRIDAAPTTGPRTIVKPSYAKTRRPARR